MKFGFLFLKLASHHDFKIVGLIGPDETDQEQMSVPTEPYAMSSRMVSWSTRLTKDTQN